MFWPSTVISIFLAGTENTASIPLLHLRRLCLVGWLVGWEVSCVAVLDAIPRIRSLFMRSQSADPWFTCWLLHSSVFYLFWPPTRTTPSYRWRRWWRGSSSKFAFIFIGDTLDRRTTIVMNLFAQIRNQCTFCCTFIILFYRETGGGRERLKQNKTAIVRNTLWQ